MQALEGLKVLELRTQLIAGPFAGKTLGEFGADVIKIEAGRQRRPAAQLAPAAATARRCGGRCSRATSARLRSTCAAPEGQDIARKLIAEADVLIENFQPGTLEAWGMGYEERCHELNPGLVMLRISGYGQTGPYRDLPGFGAIGEAMGGLRHLTGEPGRVPVRVRRLDRRHARGAARRDRHPDRASPPQASTADSGQVIDVALHEAVFNVMESLLPEYSAFGAVREARGQRAAGHRAVERLPLQRRRTC